jgi:secondary thiamine-phosphate synthase enzyme
MTVETRYINLDTKGDGDILDITAAVQDCLSDCAVSAGLVTVFTPSATSGITTLEYEPGCLSDLQRLFDEILPPDRNYAHNQRWGDGNGHSHCRAAVVKASFSIPIVGGKLSLGTWQSIVLIDFDNRPRQRRLVVQIMGE